MQFNSSAGGMWWCGTPPTNKFAELFCLRACIAISKQITQYPATSILGVGFIPSLLPWASGSEQCWQINFPADVPNHQNQMGI